MFTHAYGHLITCQSFSSQTSAPMRFFLNEEVSNLFMKVGPIFAKRKRTKAAGVRPLSSYISVRFLVRFKWTQVVQERFTV